jgi:phosphatidylglycerophosphate synthase
MVAFLISLVITIGLTGAMMAYGRKRPVGAPITWGEAMAASALVFFVLFMIYGVVPHQWLAWADSELGWRQDKILAGPNGVTNKSIGIDIPMTISFETIRDAIAAGIYIVALGVQIALWSIWQNRGKSKPKEIPTSAFGRPLVPGGVGGSTTVKAN